MPKVAQLNVPSQASHYLSGVSIYLVLLSATGFEEFLGIKTHCQLSTIRSQVSCQRVQMTKQVAIIDYRHGNANLIKNALAELDAFSVYSSNAAKIDNADCLILLGVGHHRSAMMFLVDRRLVA